MINLETIERTIDELENTRDTSYRLCERLSWLYICRDHLKPTKEPSTIATATVPNMEGSEFLSAASGKRVEDVMKVVDEHLETIKLIYPKTYDGIMSRLTELR